MNKNNLKDIITSYFLRLETLHNCFQVYRFLFVKSVGCTFNRIKQCHLKSSVAAVKEKTSPDFSQRNWTNRNWPLPRCVFSQQRCTSWAHNARWLCKNTSALHSFMWWRKYSLWWASQERSFSPIIQICWIFPTVKAAQVKISLFFLWCFQLRSRLQRFSWARNKWLSPPRKVMRCIKHRLLYISAETPVYL